MKFPFGPAARSATRFWVPLLVLTAGLLLTQRFWEQARRGHDQEVRAYFEYRQRDALNRIEERLKDYEQVLLAARGLFETGTPVSRQAFATFVSCLQADERFPGVQGIGYSVVIPAADKAKHVASIRAQGFPEYRIHPEGERPGYTAIIYLEPPVGRNLRVFGYDMSTEAVRRQALERARDTGETSMSGKVTLLQETGVDQQAGFLVYVPVYLSWPIPQTLVERRKLLAGWVYAPFRMNDLMRGVLGEAGGDLDIEIYDGPQVTPDSLMFDLEPASANPALARFQVNRALVFRGHAWTVKLQATPGLLARYGAGFPRLGWLLGGAASLLLALLAYHLVRDWERTQSRAQAGEDRYRELMDQAEDAILILEEGGRILEANRHALTHFGYSLEEMKACSLASIYEPDRPQAAEALLESLHQGVALRLQTRARRKNGSEFPVECSANRVTFGRLTYLLLVLRDVTERRQVEEALRESQQRYEALTAQVPVGIYQIRSRPDGTFGFTYASPRMGDLFGVDLEAFRKDVQLGFRAVHPEDLAAFVKLNEDGLKYTVPFHWEGRILVEGATRWLRIESTPERVENGDVLWHGLVTDVTAEREGALARQEALDRLQKIAQRVPGVVYQFRMRPDGSSCFPFASEGIREIYRVSPEEVREDASPVFAVLHPGDLQAVAASIQRSAETLTPWHQEYRVQFSDGTVRTVYGDAVPEREEDGSVLWHGYISDITERKRAEADRQTLLGQLQQSQKMESLGTLAGGVAHDMNNVLGAILGLASAHLELQPAGSPAHRAFDTICKAAHRGGNLVKSLLNFARQSPVDSQPLNLNTILAEEIRLLEHTTLAKVRLQKELAPDLQLIRGDPSALTHALMNLCVNAVDAMAEDGTLILRTRNLDPRWIEVEVEDNGSGMTQEVLDKALDPFFTTKELGKGTGLGLSMVYTIVKAHGGQMELQSKVGKGTCVKLRFPACEPEAAIPEAPADPASIPPERGLSVLLVDDDELVRSSVQSLLELLGHQPTAVATGEAALAALEGGLQADVVILDMNMPGLGGAGTLPLLRVLRPDLPVVLATGRVEEVALELVQAHPGVVLMPKPFTMDDLREQLSRSVRR